MPDMPKYLKREWVFFLDVLARIHLFFIDLIDGNLLISPRKCL